MKYKEIQKGDTTFMIPVGDPPEDKIIKGDVRKYKQMKKNLIQKMSWKIESDNQ